jgi:hypothetical protein
MHALIRLEDCHKKEHSFSYFYRLLFYFFLPDFPPVQIGFSDG